MLQPKRFNYFVLFLLSTFGFSLFWGLSSDAKPLTQLFTVSSPEDSQILEESILEMETYNLKLAKEAISVMPQDMPVRFPLGVNYPVGIRRNSTGNLPIRKIQFEAIGFVTGTGQIKPIKVSDIMALLNETLSNSTSSNIDYTPVHFSVFSLETAQNQGSYNKVPVLDLVIIDSKNKEMYLVRNVRLAGIIRDAINAILNGKLSRNYYVFNQTQIREIIYN